MFKCKEKIHDHFWLKKCSSHWKKLAPRICYHSEVYQLWIFTFIHYSTFPQNYLMTILQNDHFLLIKGSEQQKWEIWNHLSFFYDHTSVSVEFHAKILTGTWISKFSWHRKNPKVAHIKKRVHIQFSHVWQKWPTWSKMC